MTEDILAIEFLLDKLDGGLKCHCDIFRKIYGMKPATAERRLREFRDAFSWKVFYGPKLYAPGYTAHRSAHMWTFTRPFLAFLKKQIAAAYKLERQNARKT